MSVKDIGTMLKSQEYDFLRENYVDRIKIPMKVEFILNRLQETGHEAYIVGGCVRDCIMGLKPNDWDICTSALPEQVMDIFSDQNVISTGIKHGTVTVILEKSESPITLKENSFEITTYRADGEYKDNRRPESVEFISDVSLDLMRRDFTINAMAYNHNDGLVDLYGGIEDIRSRIIRCVGNPDDRFQEDALRIIRVIRFALRFGFNIDLDTYKSMQRNKALLKNISAERINSELSNIFMMTDFKNVSDNIVECLLDLIDTFTGKPIKRDINFIRSGLCKVYDNIPLGLAIIFDDDRIEDILKELRFSNDRVKEATTIRKYGYTILNEANIWAKRSIIQSAVKSQDCKELRYYARKFLNKVTNCYCGNIINFSKHICKDNEYMQIALTLLDVQIARSNTNREAYKISYLAVNGNDLIELGYHGKQIGKILNKLLDMVMNEEVLNTKTDLLSAIKIINEDEAME